MHDHLSITNDFIGAWLAQDTAQVVAHMTEDGAFYVIPPFPGTGPEYHGKEQIAAFVNGFIAGFQGEFSNLVVDGDKVTFFGRLTSDGVKAAGIDEVEQNDEVVLVNGKVQTFTIRFTPETVEKLNRVSPPQ